MARAARGLVTVAGFRPTTVGVVARERLEPAARPLRGGAAAEGRLVRRPAACTFATPAPSARAVADELQALRDEGAELLVVAGASRARPARSRVRRARAAGRRMERHGAPAHPGSLLWLARWDGLPVLGMPTCGMFSQATTFDLVLPRILAGEAMGNRELAASATAASSRATWPTASRRTAPTSRAESSSEPPPRQPASTATSSASAGGGRASAGSCRTRPRWPRTSIRSAATACG